jgi:hypothetical protein
VRPFIEITFAGYPSSLLPAELIPMLVINSRYDNKKRIPTADNDIVDMHCDGSMKKISHTLSPKKILITDGKIKAVIPCLELARTLFLHNLHITRTAFRPNGLNGMALATENIDVSEIHFNRLSDYPLTNLNSKSACIHLIWLMFDKEARKSFNSIYASLQNTHEPSWSFDFNPPPLRDWRFKLAGQYDEQDKTLFYVDEIRAFHHDKFDYPKLVHIYHPNKKEVIPIEPSNGNRPEVSLADPDPQLNLHAIPNAKRKSDIVSEEGFRFTFGETFYPKVMPGKLEKRVTPIVNPEQTPIGEETSVGHGADTGTAKELDWGINRSDVNKPEPEDAKELKKVAATSEFLLFEQAINQLMVVLKHTSIEPICLELPKPSNASFIYLNKNTGVPRTFHCAEFIYQDLPLMIIEVDLSDYPKSRRLGSRLFGFMGDAEQGFKAIMQACSDSGVHWNKDVIKQHTCIAKKIKHPTEYTKVAGKEQRKTEVEYITSWVRNFETAIKSISL